MSGKQKREKLKEERAEKAKRKKQAERDLRVRQGKMIIADHSQQDSFSYFAPREYVDVNFTCVDCGAEEVWTAKQQQWWYEVIKGSIYSQASRCRECRRKRREIQRETS